MPAMPIRLGDPVRSLCLIAALLAVPMAAAFVAASWNGVLRDAAGKPIGKATVRLRSHSGDRDYTTTTSANGSFAFAGIAATDYELSVETSGTTWHAASLVPLQDGDLRTTGLQVLSQPPELRLLPSSKEASPQAS